jgi:gamma-glutamyltranspeptidase / glutathione hydrolase
MTEGLIEGAGPVMAECCTGRGARGVVTASAPVAAAIGAEAIRSGGNAFDGVVAAALAETVLLPPKCGLGGDLIALCVRAGETEPVALIAIGGAAAGLSAVAAAGQLRETGPTSVGPPGAPAGYLALAEQGTLPLDRLAAPAIALARDGFAWAPICTALCHEAAALLREQNPAGTVYLPDERPITPGALVALPGLARVLEELVAHGATVLNGPLGAAMLHAVRRRGGTLTSDDLESVRAEWVPVDRGAAGSLPVWATPAPTHGASLLDAVAQFTGADPPAAVWGAVLAAISRQRTSLGDPAVPGGTSAVSATDAAGNAVVVVHSNSYPRFGSGIVVEGFDLVLNNRAGRGFTSTPGHPNFPVPGRRPATTLHAWAAGEVDGRPALIGATPGGVNQLPWNAQLLADVAAGELRPGVLATAPRWEWLPAGDGAVVEEDLGAAAIDALFARAPGHHRRVGRWGLRSSFQVAAVPRQGHALEAAADPRTGGAAVAV